jgi:uncharacterized protein
MLALCAALMVFATLKTPLPDAFAADASLQPTQEFYVNDYADVMEAGVSRRLVDSGERLYADSGAQIVVLTVDTVEGGSIEDYANEVFRAWGIGSKGENNGVLVLVAVEDREMRIEVGYGLEGAITDLQASDIIEGIMTPAFEVGDYGTGIADAYGSLTWLVCAEYGLDAERYGADEAVSLDNLANRGPEGIARFLPIIPAFVFFILAAAMIIYTYRNGGKRGFGGFGGGVPRNHSDTFLGGGNFGGGGSSGGGGASGRW